MRVERHQEGTVTLVKIEGVIKLGEAAEGFSAFLERLLEEDLPSVLIDMTEIDHVDSTGLGELVGYLQRFTEQGRRLALLNPHRRVLKLLELTRLDEVFPIFEDRDTALRTLQGS